MIYAIWSAIIVTVCIWEWLAAAAVARVGSVAVKWAEVSIASGQSIAIHISPCKADANFTICH
jgi:hypothetical protein